MPKRRSKADKTSSSVDEKVHPGLTLAQFLPTEYSGPDVESEKQGNDINEGSISTNSPGQLPETSASNCTSYNIMRTKKGGLPVSTESRASGKKVTVIQNVKGDAKSLLQQLKSSLGTGGIISSDGNIEIQGDMTKRVSMYLNQHKEILLPYKKN